MHQRFRRNRQHDHRGDRERPKGDRAAVDHDGDQHPPPLAPRNVLIYIGYLNEQTPRSPNQSPNDAQPARCWGGLDVPRRSQGRFHVASGLGIRNQGHPARLDDRGQGSAARGAAYETMPTGEAFTTDTPAVSDDPNAMVDDTRRIDLVLHGFRKAEQHIAAIHLAAGERGCPAGDAGSFARAIQNVVIELFDEPLIAEVAIRVLEFSREREPIGHCRKTHAMVNSVLPSEQAVAIGQAVKRRIIKAGNRGGRFVHVKDTGCCARHATNTATQAR